MKTIVLILCVLFIGCASTTYQPLQYDYGKGGDFIVTGDGRLMFWISDGRIVEMIGIGIPLPATPHFMLSRGFFYRLCLKRRLRLEYDTAKKRGDVFLAYVYVGDVFVNAEMIRRGYAYAMPTVSNSKHDATLAELEAKAKAENRVIWKKSDKPLF